MALDQMGMQPEASGGDEDTRTVVLMGKAMLKQGGLDVIKKALAQSKDKAQVIGTFLAQMTGQMAEMTAEEGIDPAIYGQPGGFLDQILDYIELQLGLPPEFSDEVYTETLETIKAASMNGQGAASAAAPAPGGMA